MILIFNHLHLPCFSETWQHLLSKACRHALLSLPPPTKPPTSPLPPIPVPVSPIVDTTKISVVPSITKVFVKREAKAWRMTPPNPEQVGIGSKIELVKRRSGQEVGTTFAIITGIKRCEHLWVQFEFVTTSDYMDFLLVPGSHAALPFMERVKLACCGWWLSDSFSVVDIV